MRRLPAWLLAIAGGAWMATGAPPRDWFIAVPTGLCAFALLIEQRTARTQRAQRSRRWLAGAGIGFAFGTAVNVFALGFVPDVIARFTPLPWALGVVALVLVAMLQSLAFTATALVTQWLRRLRVPLPIAFALGHLCGTHAPAVFPWTVAAGLARLPWSVQSANLWGEPGAATVWALIAGGVASAVLAARAGRWQRASTSSAATLAATAAVYVHGTRIIAAIEAERATAAEVTVGLVHPSYAATLRWDPGAKERLLRVLHEQTIRAERAGAALTVWPESAHPYAIAAASRRDQSPPRAVLGPGVHGPVLAGILRRHTATEETNSAILVERGGAFGVPYDKLHLLAFGEHVPFADDVAWLKHTFARGIGLIPGTHSVLQSEGAVRAGIMICFEDTLPRAARDVFEAGAPNVLINLTNDAWFTGTSEPALHVRLASLRSIETQLDMVRSVNGGISAHIDAAGRLVAKEASTEPTMLLARARLLQHGPTVFARWGELPAWGALSVMAAAGCAWARRRRA